MAYSLLLPRPRAALSVPLFILCLLLVSPVGYALF